MNVNMKTVGRSNLVLACIFLVALSLSLLFRPPTLSITYDEALYMSIARNLAKSSSNFTYQEHTWCTALFSTPTLSQFFIVFLTMII